MPSPYYHNKSTHGATHNPQPPLYFLESAVYHAWNHAKQTWKTPWFRWRTTVQNHQLLTFPSYSCVIAWAIHIACFLASMPWCYVTATVTLGLSAWLMRYTSLLQNTKTYYPNLCALWITALLSIALAPLMALWIPVSSAFMVFFTSLCAALALHNLHATALPFHMRLITICLSLAATWHCIPLATCVAIAFIASKDIINKLHARCFNPAPSASAQTSLKQSTKLASTLLAPMPKPCIDQDLIDPQVAIICEAQASLANMQQHLHTQTTECETLLQSDASLLEFPAENTIQRKTFANHAHAQTSPLPQKNAFASTPSDSEAPSTYRSLATQSSRKIHQHVNVPDDASPLPPTAHVDSFVPPTHHIDRSILTTLKSTPLANALQEIITLQPANDSSAFCQKLLQPLKKTYTQLSQLIDTYAANQCINLHTFMAYYQDESCTPPTSWSDLFKKSTGGKRYQHIIKAVDHEFNFKNVDFWHSDVPIHHRATLGILGHMHGMLQVMLIQATSYNQRSCDNTNRRRLQHTQ